MLRFLGFKASFAPTGKQRFDNFSETPGHSLTGAYRINKDELFDNIDYPTSSKQITPSMVKLPASQTAPPMKTSKSVNNLTKPQNEDNTRQSTSNISENIPKQLSESQIKEQKKLEKQRLKKQKQQEKTAAKEKEKEEKFQNEREKQSQRRDEKKKSKRRAPDPQTQTQLQTATQSLPQRQIPTINTPQIQAKKQTAPQPRERPLSTPQIQQKQPQPQSRKQITQAETTPQIAIRSNSEFSTDTLESSISRNSGPPPYSQSADEDNISESGNITFKINDSSWDMISQHRQQISRPQIKGLAKQTHLDLNFNTGLTSRSDMSDA